MSILAFPQCSLCFWLRSLCTVTPCTSKVVVVVLSELRLNIADLKPRWWLALFPVGTPAPFCRFCSYWHGLVLGCGSAPIWPHFLPFSGGNASSMPPWLCTEGMLLASFQPCPILQAVLGTAWKETINKLHVDLARECTVSGCGASGHKLPPWCSQGPSLAVLCTCCCLSDLCTEHVVPMSHLPLSSHLVDSFFLYSLLLIIPAPLVLGIQPTELYPQLFLFSDRVLAQAIFKLGILLSW